MARLGRDADTVRDLVPAAREAWAEIEANVIRSGLVEQSTKELCYRYLAGDAAVTDFGRFGDREQAALRWADAIAYGSERANDALWARLHELYSEPELVDLGCAIGFELGRQHWRRTVGLPARD